MCSLYVKTLRYECILCGEILLEQVIDAHKDESDNEKQKEVEKSDFGESVL